MNAEKRRPLTERQRECLIVLVKFTHEHHRQPSYSELREELGTTDVRTFLIELERRGWIKVTSHARAIEITSDVFDAIVKTGELPEN